MQNQHYEKYAESRGYLSLASDKVNTIKSMSGRMSVKGAETDNDVKFKISFEKQYAGFRKDQKPDVGEFLRYFFIWNIEILAMSKDRACLAEFDTHFKVSDVVQNAMRIETQGRVEYSFDLVMGYGVPYNRGHTPEEHLSENGEWSRFVKKVKEYLQRDIFDVVSQSIAAEMRQKLIDETMVAKKQAAPSFRSSVWETEPIGGLLAEFTFEGESE